MRKEIVLFYHHFFILDFYFTLKIPDKIRKDIVVSKRRTNDIEFLDNFCCFY